MHKLGLARSHCTYYAVPNVVTGTAINMKGGDVVLLGLRGVHLKKAQPVGVAQFACGHKNKQGRRGATFER